MSICIFKWRESLRVWPFIALFFMAVGTIFFQGELTTHRLEISGGTINEECPWCIEPGVTSENQPPLIWDALPVAFASDRLMLADILWMKVVYYFGQQSLVGGRFNQLFTYFDTLTSLDGEWEDPFEYAGIMLPSFANDPDGGYELILKGLEGHDDMWRLHFIKGYIEWKFFDHLEMASRSLFDASQRHGAPKMLLYLSATLANRSSQKTLTEMIVREGLKSLTTEEDQKRLFEKLDR